LAYHYCSRFCQLLTVSELALMTSIK
jgi:hypothetical protein